MSGRANITDEELVAYLDGALEPTRRGEIGAAIDMDAHIAGRIAALSLDKNELLTALNAVADAAPVSTLRARLQSKDTSRRAAPRMAFESFKFAAMLLLGILAGYAVGIRSSADRTRDWRHAVADYQTLYATSTLASIASDIDAKRHELAAAGTALGLPIKFDALQVAGLEFKRAQILQFGGQPLIQFAYLDQGGIPISFCVLRTGDADSAVRTDTIGGLAAVIWNENGYSFIIVGAAPMENLKQAALALAGQL
jgi:anti-sigma factor RsiW